jgi:uncharacterized protein YndB with AHSA1/START domain
MLAAQGGSLMTIHWPDRYAPEKVAARVSNEISIGAPPAAVWDWLIFAGGWPDWYPNSSDVRIAGGAPALSNGAAFTWRTFGVRVTCTVREFVPCERIAWDGTGTLIDIYHAWLITPHDGGCHVLTEERQNGLAARAQAAFMPNRMFEGHQLWLERLKAKAEG